MPVLAPSVAKRIIFQEAILIWTFWVRWSSFSSIYSYFEEIRISSMARPFLFGGSSGSQSQNKYLVEFRAGKMTVKGKMVHPDKRKGLVYVHQTDDSLMHFCWKDRTSGSVEDELIIFPDDAEFKKVPQCTTGRVFVLKFKSSNRRCFYWMQEPKTDKDDDFCSKVNEYLNNPPVPGSGHGSGLGSSGSSQGGLGSLQSDLSSLADGDLQNLLNNISQQQLAQFLGSSGVANLSSLLSRPSSMQSSVASSTNATAAPTPPARSGSETSTERPSVTPSSTATPTPTPQSATPAAATTPSVPSSSAGATQIQLSDVQSILSNLNETGGSSVAEALAPLLGNAELMERIRELLPTTQDTPKVAAAVPEQLKNTVQSPQFQQSLSIFSQGLQSGQLGPLMSQFGLSQEVVSAANSGDMEAFVRALQASQGKSDKKDPKDEEMSLD